MKVEGGWMHECLVTSELRRAQYCSSILWNKVQYECILYKDFFVFNLLCFCRLAHQVEVHRQKNVVLETDRDNIDDGGSDVEFSDGYKVPGQMWKQLYRFYTLSLYL